VNDTVVNLDRFKSKRGREGAPPKVQRLPRIPGLWAAVTLEELTDRRNDETYSARTRLLLFLRIKTKRGQRAWRLTNEQAASIGLDRKLKSRCLRYLELSGYVSVAQRGQRVPVVTVLSPKSDGSSPKSDSSSPKSDTGSPS
jgi:hypothetical protein